LSKITRNAEINFHKEMAQIRRQEWLYRFSPSMPSTTVLPQELLSTSLRRRTLVTLSNVALSGIKGLDAQEAETAKRSSFTKIGNGHGGENPGRCLSTGMEAQCGL